MSGRNTKISNSRVGTPRFGRQETKPNSEVVVYHLPPDEIRERYGSGPADILTREKFEELTARKMSWKQMAAELNLPYKAVTYLASKYRNPVQEISPVDPKEEQGGENMSTTAVIREKEVFDQENESIPRTKENYLMLRQRGLKDKEIAERFNMIHTNLPKYKKKWGLSDKDEIQPIDSVSVQVELEAKELRLQVEHLEKEKQNLHLQLQQHRDNSEKLYKQSLEAIQKFDETSKELIEWKLLAERLKEESDEWKQKANQQLTEKIKLEQRVNELEKERQEQQAFHHVREQHLEQAHQTNSHLFELEELNLALRRTLKLVL